MIWATRCSNSLIFKSLVEELNIDLIILGIVIPHLGDSLLK